jgi:hypothetical protein
VSTLHEEVLPSAAAGVFERLGIQPELSRFYLAGGTGAALVLGHRRSEDLDLSCERRWSWEHVAPALAAAGEVVVDRQEEGTFVGSVGDVRVSLFHYPYVLLDEPMPTRFGVPIASLRDIGCMKLVAVSQRGSRKDFVDLYHLGLEGLTVRDLLSVLPRKMPGIELNSVHVLRSLAYFEDAEAEPDPVMLVAYDWPQVREYCLRQAEALLAEVVGDEDMEAPDGRTV